MFDGLFETVVGFYRKKKRGRLSSHEKSIFILQGELIMSNVSGKELALEVCKALADKRGKDVVVLDVRGKTDLCDYFVVGSGSNAPQIKAMGERVEELIEKNLGIVPTRTEGVRDGRWAVIDYGDVIVHIFNDETRLFYHLEKLWTDGGNLERFDDKSGELISDK